MPSSKEKNQKSKFERIKEAYINEVFALKEYNEERKKVEKVIEDIEDKLNTSEVSEKLKFIPNDILVKKDIDFINSIKYPEKYKIKTKFWNEYTREEKAELLTKYVEEIELTDKYGFLNVDYIKFRESVANVSNELYFNGYYDRYIPSIFGNIYGQIRFSEYLPEKEVGEQIMRLRQFYDVGYYEATYNVKNQVFYFNFVKDNRCLVRVFSLEDYRKIDPDMKMETYNLGVLYVKEDDGTLLEHVDDVFKYIPAGCDCNVVYSKEPIMVDVKPVPYYEEKEENSENDLDCELIIELGNKKYWDTKDMDFKRKMTNVYKQQVDDLEMLVPNFKIASAIIHYDETSPHMHIVGVPIKEKNKYGMELQVGKSDVFTKDSLKVLQDKMRTLCIEEFNKEYELDSILKKKKKGRNDDRHVSEMENYAEMQEAIERHQMNLDKANESSKDLDNNTNEIKDIVNDLKNVPLSKNNYILKQEDKDKLVEYFDKVDKTNNDYKTIQDLSVSLKDISTELSESKETIKILQESNDALELRNTKLKEENNKLKSRNSSLENELKNLKETFEIFKNKLERLYHFFVDKMWGNKEKRDKYYGVAYELYGKSILDDKQMKGILGTKERSAEIDNESKSHDDDKEL